jgi:hypothetical protein
MGRAKMRTRDLAENPAGEAQMLGVTWMSIHEPSAAVEPLYVCCSQKGLVFDFSEH